MTQERTSTPEKQSDYVITSEVDCARQRLTDWVVQTAADVAHRIGIAWVARADAPSAYPELCDVFIRSVADGLPLPVSSENSASVILCSTEANFAWRFVHDVAHVERCLSFSIVDEYALALWHLAELERAGFGPESLEYAFLKADTLGQVMINGLAHRFPEDQRRFDLDCQQRGFEQGVLRELRRTPL